jgi:hypothetical protein
LAVADSVELTRPTFKGEQQMDSRRGENCRHRAGEDSGSIVQAT